MTAIKRQPGETRIERWARLAKMGYTRRQLNKLGAKPEEMDAVGMPRLHGGPVPKAKPIKDEPCKKLEPEMWMEPCGWVKTLSRPFEIGEGNWYVNVRNKFKEELCVLVEDLS